MVFQQPVPNYPARQDKTCQVVQNKADMTQVLSVSQPWDRPRSRTKRPFRSVLEGVRSEAIRSLLNRAALTNSLAESAKTAPARRHLHQQTAKAIARSLELFVEEIRLTGGAR